jgi:hypothetical protein
MGIRGLRTLIRESCIKVREVCIRVRGFRIGTRKPRIGVRELRITIRKLRGDERTRRRAIRGVFSYTKTEFPGGGGIRVLL